MRPRPICCIVASEGAAALEGRSSMKVKDVMHKGVEWVSPDTPITEIAKLMQGHDVGCIPRRRAALPIGMQPAGCPCKQFAL